MVGFVIWFDLEMIGVADNLDLERQRADLERGQYSDLLNLGFHGGVRVSGDATYLSQNWRLGDQHEFHAYEDKNAQETAPEMNWS